MNEVTSLQKKRAENIIWNSAGNYSFTPDFKAFDKDGNAELYWNCIIGAARKHYEYDKFLKLFRSLEQYEEVETYEGLVWLGLENALFLKERDSRPALTALREDYAAAVLKSLPLTEATMLYDYMAKAHFERVLNLPVSISRYDIKLLDELEFEPELTTDEIIERCNRLFTKWFLISTEEKPHRKFDISSLFGQKVKLKRQKDRKFRRFGRGFAELPENAFSDDGASSHSPEDELKTKLSAAELREFMESKFGEPILPPHKVNELERQVCSDGHNNCHILLTDGRIIKSKIQNGFEALQKEKEAAQIERNKQSFKNNYAQNMITISRLAAKIQNSVLLYLQPADTKSDAGELNGSLAWRALKLEDGRVFTRHEKADAGSLSVDILLDASTSQKKRQEIVSAQGYMIAEALTRCNIPCRVMSFCSMTGFTIMRVFRDYNKKGDNSKIFDYVSNGCNRDGLAIKLAHHLMNNTGYEHKVLIVLSDVKPNDVLKIQRQGKGADEEYENIAGLMDTAREVRRARADGIAVVCVFTGTDEDVASAKLVYGRDFTRIQSLDKLADAVGMLIQNQIKIIS